ncbi:hypothetical protein CLCR_02237 [Cladophialophora carrionii]|uniref:DUF7932 domain-containing protein n=1 Tax=Cladophialophora carrionii TaxID=86049 RepID=A0A1C1CEK1_9EURO|nr:hypothetical protein CLCR_02237 [Cladophialophora carrionii]
MQSREKILLEASGKPGNHGFQYYGERDGVAPAGRPGANGRSSCVATNGEDGKDIHVQLKVSEKPGTVLVMGVNNWKGTRWEVNNEQILLLDCKGGDGGNGGRGEDGQQGGEGAKGRNATKYRDAEDGQPGARGGDGGYGTDGANGGKAGNVFIQLAEEDMDLLLPVYWDIRGGKGGGSGTHGNPGDGGIGGQGGDGIRWEERYGNTVHERSRPRGAVGPQGPPGNRPASYLSGGLAGVNGSSQVTVMRMDGTSATYPSGYVLKVVSFDICDENQDGINEPGEHLLVSNIKVQNTGGMPSPKAADIDVLIHGTHWLDPIVSEPVRVPKDIKPGQTVLVPGTLKAFICHERSTRGPGQLLHATDEVQLIATATRLGRTLPDFSGKTGIVIRYPLELDAPKYLDCVEKGDEVVFSWTLRNVSTKPYGIQSALARDAGTILCDPGHVFDFENASETAAHKTIDLLEELDPGCEVPISQTFRVSQRALEYDEAHLKLELMLSDPNAASNRDGSLSADHPEHPHLRPVVWYGMRMQIAGTYSYNHNASFLLVVNAYTVNKVIHQAMRFIRNELGLAYDIFNVSVNGNLISPVTGRHILEDYQGKSIILFTNSFPYFSRGQRTIFNFLDPTVVGVLAQTGTSISLFGPSQSSETAIKWSSMLGFLRVRTGDTEDDSSIRTNNLDELRKSVYDGGHHHFDKRLAKHGFASQKTLFSGGDRKLDADAKQAAQKMAKTFPLRRFTVHGNPEVKDSANSTGFVEIYEGLPMAAKIRYSLQDFDANGTDIPDFNKYAIIASLPFAMRVEMLWNIVKSGGTVSGVNTVDLYHVKSTEVLKTAIAVTEQRLISDKLCRAITLSIEHDLVHEFSLFNSKVPWPDVLPGPESIRQLPLLTQFFTISAAQNAQLSSTEGTNALAQLLATLLASLAPTSFGQLVTQTILFGAGSRKAKLRPQLNTRIGQVLDTSFTPDAATQLRQNIDAHEKVVKASLKAAGSTRKGLHDIMQRRMGEFVGDGSSTAYFDLPQHNPVLGAAEVLPRGAPGQKIAQWEEYMRKVNEEWAFAEEMRREMVTSN